INYQLPQHKKLIIDAGALPCLVDLLRRHKSCPICSPLVGLLRIVANAICYLASDNTNIKTLVRMEGGIPPLVELVEFNVTELQKAVASGLATLAYDNHDNKKQIVECGALRTLVLMLQSEDSKMHYEAGVVIEKLVHSSPDITKEVLAAGALEPVICLLSSGCWSSKKQAARLIGIFAATDSDCKVHIIQRGVIPQLLDMLNSHGEMAVFALGSLAPESHNQAVLSLYGLADNELADFIEAGGFQKLKDGHFKYQCRRCTPAPASCSDTPAIVITAGKHRGPTPNTEKASKRTHSQSRVTQRRAISSAVNMLHNKSFVKKTKGGKVIKYQVREHYLRDDIYCGAPFCTVCDSSSARLSASPSTILFVDTNVVLNQIDLLENPAIDDVVVLSIVLEEVKNKNMSVYNRIRAICSHSMRKFFVFSNEYHRDTYIKEMSGETKNDRNDRAIRVPTQWYQNHLGGAVKVLLITNDKENKRKASEEGILAETVESYVKSLDQPDLLDLLVRPASEDVDMEEVEDLRPSKRKVIYSEHKPMSEITSGLHRGIYHHGKLRVNRYNPFEAYVGSESIGDEIIIYGRSNMNRAFDGDIEAAELLPQDQWQGVSSLSIAHEEPVQQQRSGPDLDVIRWSVVVERGGDGIRSDGGVLACTSTSKLVIQLQVMVLVSLIGKDEDEDEDVHLAPNSADDAPRTIPQQGSSEQVNAVPSRPSGRIVGIIKRNWHSYCGSLEPMPMPAGSGGIAHALFVSKDRRIPKIRIQTRQVENLLDKRIIVEVDSWDCQSRYPSGHYVRTIGEIGDRDTESEVWNIGFCMISLFVSIVGKTSIIIRH
ncbi:Exosome complex exonuclease RRP44-like A, partial [Glycine soja]